MPSVSCTFGREPITERQLRRLFAIAYGTREERGALGGSKRDKANQLYELLQQFGLEWDAVDQDGPPRLWINQHDYDELIVQLEAMRGGL